MVAPDVSVGYLKTPTKSLAETGQSSFPENTVLSVDVDVCQVAVVGLVAVNTCPLLGAVALETFTTVVALLRASVLALFQVVS